MNGGHCYDDDTDFVCICSPGFKGRLCESGKYLISHVFIVRFMSLIILVLCVVLYVLFVFLYPMLSVPLVCSFLFAPMIYYNV